ncbi:MAG: efflux RND transporter periplasmic adaptor subunit [Cyclobacteriaceae bacterium]|nr:efflux RND transporter periplasmic adaptor subunit [Cyclobacteriaceae bacterium]UYN88054.1 MAG: efflux RND transporter periplasmic adaptor subunit [Cyclobacteriaceae bacterium]
MKNTYLIIAFAALVAACSAPTDKAAELEAKKKQLEQAQVELATIKNKIAQLEKEISDADPNFARQISKAILVSTFTAEKKAFEHKIEVRGAVESRRNIVITAQTGGEIHKVHVREGQNVSKGQVLVSLNADIIRNSIAELKTALELANSVYEKQARLWEQKIGTELQYLQAKNNKESLERRLATAYSQLDQAIIKAPFSGTIDQLPAREGEVAGPGMPLVRVVSLDDTYIKADVSERFIGKFKTGDPVEVYFPSQDKKLNTKVASVSQVINAENRTFIVEVQLPRVDFIVKPNQVVVLNLRDYLSEATLAVPTRIIQKDEDGQFIFAVDDREGRLLAKKIHITTGITSMTETEVVAGLKGDEQIVDQGYRDLTEGVEVEIFGAKKNSKEVANK